MKISSKNKNPIDFSPAVGSEVFQTRRGYSGFCFFFGNSPDLAKKEVDAVVAKLLPFLKYDYMITRQVALYKNQTPFSSLSNAQKLLGGTIKVAQVLTQVLRLDNLAENLATLIKSQSVNSGEKINLAISNYSEHKIDVLRLSKDIKRFLKKNNFSCRFVLPKEGSILSSAQIFHNQLDREVVGELNIFDYHSGLLIAKTQTVQNPNSWSDVDFGIPAPDTKSGMLPPKLARMMLNLRNGDNGENKEIIFDPFCGNGRILLEAARLNMDFIGSDIDPVKVEATKKNLRWLKNRYHLNLTDEQIEKQVFIADAQSTHYSLLTTHYSIVTEPNLGPALRNLPTVQAATKIAQDLESLYLNSIQNLSKISEEIILVIPAWRTAEGQVIKLSDIIIDKLNALGYHISILGEYSRPNSFVIREITRIRGA